MNRTSAFSLFEVLIALTIFGGAIVVLSGLVDTGAMAAGRARDLSRAQLLCEAKLEELLLQNTVPVSLPETAMESGVVGQIWSYQVDVMPAMAQGLFAVRVTVRAAQPGAWTGKESYFSLIRWMPDPTLGLDVPLSSQSTGSTATETTP